MKGKSVSTPPKKPRRLNSPEAYNLWSQNYDRFDNPMLAMVDHAFALDPLNLKGRKVIELGCGTGRNIERLFAAGATSYVGLDQSPGMLTSAQSKHPDATFLSADIQARLPLNDGCAEFVLTTLVFEHLQRLQSTLFETYRVLSPGGALRILEIHSDLWNRGTKAHFQHNDTEIELPSYPHNANDWKDALSKAGFQFVSIKSLFADSEAIKRCSKLSKHAGQAVLFDIQAIKDPR
jgi:ubiquinone/menaquinone biosynthesis C-methylase UbiE